MRVLKVIGVEHEKLGKMLEWREEKITAIDYSKAYAFLHISNG